MKQRTRIPKRRQKPRVIHPERSGGHLRLRLYGKARSERRREIFERSQGRCEAMRNFIVPEVLWHIYGASLISRCNRAITWDLMEWSHNRHGANKCDCLDCGIASCKECHARRHNPKPCPKKVA